MKYVAMGINIEISREREFSKNDVCFCPVQLLDHLFPPTENIRQELDIKGGDRKNSVKMRLKRTTMMFEKTDTKVRWCDG